MKSIIRPMQKNRCYHLKVNHNIVLRNGKIAWKHGPYWWYFPLKLKQWGWSYRQYINTAKNGNFCEELHGENDFDAILLTFCCYGHDANASEAVEKIITDQKEYYKCFLCSFCWIAKIYLSVNNSEKKLVTRTSQTWLKKLQKLYRIESNNWPRVSFIHNGREITTWMGIASKPSAQYPKQHF